MSSLENEVVGKKILFYGPANTTDKKDINIDNYDFVVITNNALSYFFETHDLKSCKVIHMSNCIYAKKFNKLHEKYESNIEFFFVLNKKSEEILIKRGINKDKIIIIVNENQRKIYKNLRPLGLNIFLLYFKHMKFESIYITGVTFYQNASSVEECYEDNRYLVDCVHGKLIKDKKNSALENVHPLEKNIKATMNICNEYKNISYCDEMKDVMNMYKI